jgi:hypothetical protein
MAISPHSLHKPVMIFQGFISGIEFTLADPDGPQLNIEDGFVPFMHAVCIADVKVIGQMGCDFAMHRIASPSINRSEPTWQGQYAG